ncbi:MAG: hypothetical protein HOP28_07390 [Gemmatimonadales bacterium]|nr:hypothetical protein [Gemmatimonadales bacterium]
MSHASLTDMMASHIPQLTNGPGDPLVPLLPAEEGAPDPVAIATWHLALSSTTAVEVPHDLFGLWLFPGTGGVLLLGPEALAQDRVAVPLPDPTLKQDQLFTLEEVLRKAKYGSAIAVPVRYGDRDVGVMLLGAFAKGAFGPAQAVALHRLGASLAGTLHRLAGVMQAVTPHATLEPAMSAEAMPEYLARAAVEAANGPDLVRRASGVLYALLPHDKLEIVTPGTTDAAFFPLSGSAPRRRWGKSGGVVEPFAAIIGRFGAAPTLLVDDLGAIEHEGAWEVGGSSHGSMSAHAVLGARMEVGGQVVGYLLLGSVGKDTYHGDEEELIGTAATLLAPRVAGLRAAAEVEALKTAIGDPADRIAPLAAGADALARTAHLGDAVTEFRSALAVLLPHDAITLHLRWAEDDLIALDPEAPRPFADLSALPLEEFEGRAVLVGERDWLVRSVEEGEEILVPLVVAGRTIGVLGVRGRSFQATRDAATTARLFANVLAPHLELLRRGASLGPPIPARW